MELYIHSQASKVWEWVSNFIRHSIGMWLPIHTGVKVNPCYQTGPSWNIHWLNSIVVICSNEVMSNSKSIMASSKIETFSRYWPFVRGIHRSLLDSPHKGQRRGALMFSLTCAWTNHWVNIRDAGDLKRYRAHYDITLTGFIFLTAVLSWHVRHFVTTWWPEMEWQQNEISVEFEMWWKRSLTKKSGKQNLSQLLCQLLCQLVPTSLARGPWYENGLHWTTLYSVYIINSLRPGDAYMRR